MSNATGTTQRDLTKNQSAVLDVLTRASKPLGAYDILNELRDVGFKGPPQVYRALEKLVTLGFVHRIESLNAFVACDHGPHDDAAAFMICNDCQKTVELPLSNIAGLIGSDALPKGFHVEEVKVEIKGRCLACSK